MNERYVWLGWLFAFTLLAAVTAFVAMPNGPGVSRDSGQYFRYAQILRGQAPVRDDNGVAVSLTHYPPGYPVTLATLNKVGMTYLGGARLVNAVCFGLTCGLGAWVLLRNGRGVGRAAVAGLLLLTQPALTFIHLWAVSEPPFLLLTMIVFVLLVEYRSTTVRGLWLAAGIGVALALACQVRYVGVAYLPAVCWLMVRADGRRLAWRDVLVTGVVTLLPIGAMAYAQRSLAGEVAHRDFGFEGLGRQHLIDLLTVIRGWLVSPELLGVWAADKYWRFVIGVVAWVLAAGAAVGLFTVTCWKVRRSVFGGVTLVVVGVYLVLLTLSILFVDHGTPLDDRLLAPVAMLLVVWLAADLPTPNSLGRPWAALAAILYLLIAANGVARSVVQGVTSYRVGYGANAKAFAESRLLAAVRELPPQANIYSNLPEVVQLHGGHTAYILPGKTVTNGTIGEDENSVVRERLKRSGYVVFFSYKVNTKLPGKPMAIDEIYAAYPLKKVAAFPDGILLQWKGDRPAPKPPTTQGKKKKKATD